MRSLNKATLIGNLTRDPEIRQTPTGKKVTSFGVATNEQWKDAQGALQERAEFHNVVAWDPLASIIEQYVKKGDRIYIEGRLQTRSWEDQAGVKHFRTEVIAQNMIMLGARRGAPQPQEAPSATASQEEEVQTTSEQKQGAEAKKKNKGENEEDTEEVKIEEVPF
ncbi:single-stranded DNA-binding protein [bacterium (Candidatus Torokbacteria) CG_4_10_14_0_2_um_filter_35_8]|nr:MAG: single-stranded DNA-binding protein [bacterium (Candidatus Torokbacteria) CG_4_10_14_0_2_um_filter_35_8]